MINGSSFSIRTILEEDLDDLVFLLGDSSKLGDHLPIELISQRQFRQEFEKNGFWTDEFKRLVIVSNDQIIGMIWIFRSVPYFDALELGYRVFEEEHRGKGIMSEAMMLVVDYLFSSLRVNRLEIRCDTENEASSGVANKLGFSLEGTSRQANFARGAYRDMYLFALLRAEWESTSAQGRS